MNDLSIGPLLLSVACAGVALYALGYNWVAFIRAQRGKASDSPIFIVGPLFSFIGAGMAVKAGLPLSPSYLWVPPLVVVLLDPAGIGILGVLFKKHSKE